MLAHAIATPVLSRLAAGSHEGTLLWRGDSAAYVELGDFVLAITSRTTPLMPNGIGLIGELPPLPSARTRVSARPGRIDFGSTVLSWDPGAPPRWSPRVAASRIAPRELRLQQSGVLDWLGIEPAGGPVGLSKRMAGAGVPIAAAPAVCELLRALVNRDGRLAAGAAASLLGLGRGLTPEADDFVAALALSVVAFARTCGWTETEQADWLDGLLPRPLHEVTGSLSATLLELAVAGHAAAPIRAFLGSHSDRRQRLYRAERLAEVGDSTGPTYVAAIATAAVLLGHGARRSVCRV